MGKDKRTFSKARACLSHCLVGSFILFFLKKNQSVFGVGGRIGEGGGV